MKYDREHTAEFLQLLIGQPPKGSHPDEWGPRADSWHAERLNWQHEVERLRDANPAPPGSVEQLTRRSDRETICKGGEITVRCVAEWLASLPEEWQDAPFEAVFEGMPVTLKRIVAYQSKDGSTKGVAVNSMGTHLGFDDSLEWKACLSA